MTATHLAVTDLTDAFTAGGFPVIPKFGQGIEREEINVSGSNVERILEIVDFRPDLEFMRDTDGLISQGRAIMWVIGRKSKATVEAFNAWLSEVFTATLGGFGLPGSGPTTYNGVDFYLWRPIGGQVQSAERWGNFWIVEQLIEFAARKET